MRYTPEIQELLEKIFAEGYSQGFRDGVKDNYPDPDIEESESLKKVQTLIEKSND